MEDFIGKPYVYTVDINNNSQMISVMKEIKAAKVNQIKSYETIKLYHLITHVNAFL